MIKAEDWSNDAENSVSHDPSEIILICWFAAQETFLIIINVENGCAAQYFCGNSDTFFGILWWIVQMKFKRTAFT